MRAAVERLYAAMGPGVEISGGSVANTIAGIASLGGQAGFIGKTAARPVRRGVRPRHPRRRRHLHDAAGRWAASPTGRCLVLVTPDGQRTMTPSWASARSSAAARWMPS